MDVNTENKFSGKFSTVHREYSKEKIGEYTASYLLFSKFASASLLSLLKSVEKQKIKDFIFNITKNYSEELVMST